MFDLINNNILDRKIKRRIIIFKYEIEKIADYLLNPCYKAKFDLFKILSCT